MDIRSGPASASATLVENATIRVTVPCETSRCFPTETVHKHVLRYDSFTPHSDAPGASFELDHHNPFDGEFTGGHVRLADKVDLGEDWDDARKCLGTIHVKVMKRMDLTGSVAAMSREFFYARVATEHTDMLITDPNCEHGITAAAEGSTIAM